MPLDPEIVELVKGLARIEEGHKAIHARLDDLVRTKREDHAEIAERVAALRSDVDELRRWQSKVLGLAAGVGVGSGAVGAVIARALGPIAEAGLQATGLLS